MVRFCDNPLCRLHSVEMEGPEFNVVEYVEANGNKVKTKRRIISDAAKPNQTWAFCQICAFAIAMVNEGKT